MPFSPSHLLCVAGIMTRTLAAVDDMVTETIWWLPINNLDGLGRSLEQEGAGRQKERGRKWEAEKGRRENQRREGKAWNESGLLVQPLRSWGSVQPDSPTRCSPVSCLSRRSKQRQRAWYLLSLDVQTEGTLEGISVHPWVIQLKRAEFQRRPLTHPRSYSQARRGQGQKPSFPIPELYPIQHTTSQPGLEMPPSSSTKKKKKKFTLTWNRQNSMHGRNKKDF